MASLVLALHRYAGLANEEMFQPMQTHLLILVTLPLAALMVSTVPYPALVRILRPRGKRPFIHLVVMLLALGGMMFFIEAAMFLCFAGYTAYGPVRVCYRAIRRKPAMERKPQPPEFGQLPKKRRRRSRATADFPWPKPTGRPTQQGEE